MFLSSLSSTVRLRVPRRRTGRACPGESQLASQPSLTFARPGRAKAGADVQNRTGDLVLTKDALCQLSYIGQLSAEWGLRIDTRSASQSTPHNPQSAIWSGRRGSNPRPTAWKAVTLPLSYSRLSHLGSRIAERRLGLPMRSAIRTPKSALRNTAILPIGGEGRTRTFEAARATDLQSAAFDRFATSPASCDVGKVTLSTELAKGFEPLTC